MLCKQIEALVTIMKDEDMQKYAGNPFWDLIEAALTKDPFAGVEAAKNIKELIFHAPTALFWSKMKQFLFGTFHSYEDQIKMAQKFNKNNEDYVAFVKRQIHLIDTLNDYMKVDYFATLTRCFLSTDLDSKQYFKLCNFLSTCTPEELAFIKSLSYNSRNANTVMISALYQYGLFTSDEDSETGKTYYILSGYAKAFKQNSLNYEDELREQERLCSYEQLDPLNLPESISLEEMAEIIRNN